MDVDGGGRQPLALEGGQSQGGLGQEFGQGQAAAAVGDAGGAQGVDSGETAGEQGVQRHMGAQKPGVDQIVFAHQAGGDEITCGKMIQAQDLIHLHQPEIHEQGQAVQGIEIKGAGAGQGGQRDAGGGKGGGLQDPGRGQGGQIDPAQGEEIMEIHAGARGEHQRRHHRLRGQGVGRIMAGEIGQARQAGGQEARRTGQGHLVVVRAGDQGMGREQGTVNRAGSQDIALLAAGHGGGEISCGHQAVGGEIAKGDQTGGEQGLEGDVITVLQHITAIGLAAKGGVGGVEIGAGDQGGGGQGGGADGLVHEMIGTQGAVGNKGGDTGTVIHDQIVGVHQAPGNKIVQGEIGQHIVEPDLMGGDVIVEVTMLEQGGILEVNDIEPHVFIGEIGAAHHPGLDQVEQGGAGDGRIVDQGLEVDGGHRGIEPEADAQRRFHRRHVQGRIVEVGKIDKTLLHIIPETDIVEGRVQQGGQGHGPQADDGVELAVGKDPAIII